MDYQQYRALRDRVLESRSPLRLDCMNPVKSLAHLAPAPPPGAAVSIADVKAAWRDLFQPPGTSEQLSLTAGVRHALRGIFALLAARGYEAWLPEDVYPVYGELAGEQGLTCKTFVTYPRLLFASRDVPAPRSFILLPSPLSPAGRRLTAVEVAMLQHWLRQDAAGRVILDAVYHFDNRIEQAALALWESGRAFVIHSLAKAWLAPETLGTVLTPTDAVDDLSSLLSPPCPESLRTAHHCLRERPDVPRVLQQGFDHRWRTLAPTIRAVVPAWTPPETGYFSTLPLPFEELLERHNWLTVPASVFGSRRADCSVVTCLYYPEEGGRDRAAP
jgi:aspartate/methionine/tyrosine aminotransferase